jgi:hypothetical protein
MAGYRYDDVAGEQKLAVEGAKLNEGAGTDYHDVDVFGHEEGHQVSGFSQSVRGPGVSCP